MLNDPDILHNIPDKDLSDQTIKLNSHLKETAEL